MYKSIYKSMIILKLCIYRDLYVIQFPNDIHKKYFYSPLCTVRKVLFPYILYKKKTIYVCVTNKTKIKKRKNIRRRRKQLLNPLGILNHK